MLSEKTVIIGSIAISIVLHIVVVPLFFSEDLLHVISTSKSTHLETESQDPDPIVLGIDESTTSTLTWIGYKEYKLHMAQFSQYEQASMVASDVQMQPSDLIEALQKLAPPLSAFADKLVEALKGIEISIPSKELPVKPSHVETPPTEEATQEQSETTQEATESDRDSTPTSIIRISPDVWKSGRPLAAEGIVLRPRKPSFTANQLVTNTASDLIAALHIDKMGKPVHVERVMSTGSQSIDRALIASLYRWRASGDRIDAIDDDETITITIHITFSTN